MPDAKRYRIDLYGSGTWMPHTDPNGRWVRYEDYRAAYERGRREERERIAQWLEAKAQEWSDDDSWECARHYDDAAELVRGMSEG